MSKCQLRPGDLFLQDLVNISKTLLNSGFWVLIKIVIWIGTEIALVIGRRIWWLK